MLLCSSQAFGLPSTGIPKEEAIAQAKEWAEQSNPPMNSTVLYDAHAVYMSNENAWIVDFVDPSSTNPEYMLRVEATSGKSPDLLKGSQIDRYKHYFENISKQ
jgi:hypothetical protein